MNAITGGLGSRAAWVSYVPWYQISLEGIRSADRSLACCVEYWCKAEHLGAAIAAAFDAESSSPEIEVARLCDVAILEEFEPPQDAWEVSPGQVWVSTEVCWYPRDDHGLGFLYPIGVIPAILDKGEHDRRDSIVEGFEVQRSRDLWYVEAVVRGDRIEDMYCSLVEELSSVSKIDVSITDDFDDVVNGEIWENTRIAGTQDVIELLNRRRDDLIRNGFVEFDVLQGDVDFVLRLSEHKLIEFQTEQKSWRDWFIKQLEKRGLGRNEPLYRIDDRVHHYHYRPRHSLSLWDLREQLKADAFVLLEGE